MRHSDIIFGLFLITGMALPSACKAIRSEGASEAKTIFGDDERQTANWNSYFQNVGQLTSGGGTCTATLVAPTLALTAAHCLTQTDEQGRGVPRWLSGAVIFEIKDRGRVVQRANVAHMWVPDRWFYQGDFAADIALIELDRAFQSWADVGSTSRFVGRLDIELYGYSSDWNGVGHWNPCTADFRGGTIVYHYCDTAPGSSGGPMFQVVENTMVILGVNVRQYQNRNELVTVDSNDFFNIILNYRRDPSTAPWRR